MFRVFYREVKKATGIEDRFLRESEHADLASTIAFKLAKERRKKPQEVAEELIEEFEIYGDYIGKIEVVNGYINFFASPEFFEDTINAILDEDYRYGALRLGGEVLIEHTSANPDGPLHVGHIRNSIIGDTLARILRKAGVKVETQYYVNDMGRQSAMAVLGVRRYGIGEGKPDHEVAKAYVRINADAERDDEIDRQVEELMVAYERGDEEVVREFRSVIEKALEGIRETLGNLNVEHDSYVWESEFVRNGYVDRIFEMLEERGLLIKDDVYRIDMSRFGYEKDLILKRENGTTLYVTRDLAYHLWKNENYERFMNVLGADHKLIASQLSDVLKALGLKAPEIVFFEFVSLPEGSMSTRKGKFVSADELIEKTVEEARRILADRDFSEEEKEHVAKAVAVGALRYDFVRVSPEKPMTFDWRKALDFERQTASYIQYTHARACSIMRKAVEMGYADLDFNSAMMDGVERELILLLSKFSFVVEKVVESLKPNIFAEYLMDVAEKFSDFYHRNPVITDDSELRMHRLAIVDATRIVLRNGLELLGIEPLERM
ncbi:arginyl-tRNA synthetase [Geoglobus ahangari]|uniref:Arginine--tRNA ligase n=1 Tax=Geoglobus ahangari TaxID=113653 RepID=A0A0F7IH02_9EURY|nr:arginine--tRNA ligase [Geoglobus ahangari]AKG92578.1 arginyl-tRNA synthetase [Geoglobus ahangari]